MPVQIPAEGPYTDTELNWIESEPPGLFPSDQSSLWGQARKIFAGYLQREIIAKLDSIYNSLDPATADIDGLTRWEVMLGIPVNPARSIEQRRAFVQSRRERGPFTYARRRRVIEAFITATFGPAVVIGGGIPLDADGVPLASGEDSLLGSYAIVENIPDFSYVVYLLDDLDVDMDGLTRELERITPAPITFTIEEVSGPTVYSGIVLADDPEGYWPLGKEDPTVDLSGNGHTLTMHGTTPEATLVASDGDRGATRFNGVNDYAATAGPLLGAAATDFSIEIWSKLDIAPAGGVIDEMIGVAKPTLLGRHYLSYSGNAATFTKSYLSALISKVAGGSQATQVTPQLIQQRRHNVLTYSGSSLKVYQDAVLLATVATGGGALDASGPVNIGRGPGTFFNWFPGVLGHGAVYDHALTQDAITKHFELGSTTA